MGQNVRIAHRKVFLATLKKSFHFDLNVLCFDVNPQTGCIAVSSGKTVHVVNIETNMVKVELGKSGEQNRGDILTCSFSLTGEHIATGGTDRRLIIWNVAKAKVQRLDDI